MSRAPLLLLLLLSRLCSNAPCGTGAGVIIGSMAVRERERERREGLEYRVADSYLVARRCAAFQLQATTIGESMCVKEMEGTRRTRRTRRQDIHVVHSVPQFSLSCSHFAALGPAALGPAAKRQAPSEARAGSIFFWVGASARSRIL